jgi:hypothetical protein
MKAHRFFVVLVVLLALPLAAFAFDFAAGIIGGGAFPFYTGSDFKDFLASNGFKTKFRFGYGGGGFFTIGMIDLLAFQPEVMASVMGANYGNSVLTVKETLFFIEVPVLLKVRFKVGKLGLHPYIGPDFLFHIADWIMIKDEVTGLVAVGTRLDEYSTLVIGAVGGLGLLFPVGRGVMTLDARYHLGLMSIFKAPMAFAPAAAPDWKQNNIQLLIGYGFSVVE